MQSESLGGDVQQVLLMDILEIERHAAMGINSLLCKIKKELLAHDQEDVTTFHLDHRKIIPEIFRQERINRSQNMQRTYVMIVSMHRLMNLLVNDVKNWSTN